MLTHRDRESGSASVESIFAIVFVMILALGAIQVAFLLYGRNVIAAAAHEGARAAVELGRGPADAIATAVATARGAAAGMARHVEVTADVRTAGDARAVDVEVSARLRSFGPIPISPIVVERATAMEEVP